MLLHGLKSARAVRRLTRQEVALRAGLSVEVIKRLEQGVGSVANLTMVMSALDWHFSGLGRGATISHQVVARRRALGLSGRELAKLAFISPKTLAAIERSEGTLAPLLKVVRVLGIGREAEVRPVGIRGGRQPQASSSILVGDALETLKTFDPDFFQTCVTSPPYFGHRDYGVDGQLGLEESPERYIEKLVTILGEVRRVLRSDGTLFLNVGDSYRSKNLLGIPWRLALALQNDGWHLRQDIIWSKPNPMPEPVRDRCVRSHEYIFLLSKGRNYVFDPLAIRERGASRQAGAPSPRDTRDTHGQQSGGNTGINRFKLKMGAELEEDGFILRNKRSVWEVQVTPSRHGHYAAYPESLVEYCLLAASRVGDTVLDPFAGTGTTGVVAERLGRECQLIELNPEYARSATVRLEAARLRSKA